MNSSDKITQPVSTAALLITLALLSSACSNRTGSAKNATSDISKIISSSSSNVFTVSKVVKNATAPDSTFDILGDGSGAIGNACTSTGGASADPNIGSSTCVCVLTYTKTEGGTESFETQTLYHEGDLLRCAYSGVPAATTQVDVKIRVPVTGQTSNTTTFKFSGSASPVDSSNALNFSQVQRYQCRRLIHVPYMFDPSKVNDPFQIEDSHLGETLNFYTTNMGATFSYYAGGVNGGTPPYGWYCPSIPNDPAAGFDLNLFSAAADGAGSKRIYPATGSLDDRHTFYVAKKPTGVFTLPVNAYIAPFIVTSTATGAAPPIGYAAAPIPSTTVKGQEICPDVSVPIPAGYKWAKLWLFRMSMPIKKYSFSQTLFNLNEVACSPGQWSNSAQPDPLNHLFPDCHNLGNTTGSMYLSQLSTYPGSLVSRYLTGTGMCMNVDPTRVKVPDASRIAGPGYSTNAGGTVQATYAQLGVAAGSDVWYPNGSDPSYRCGGSKASDPAHVCDARHTPYDNNLQSYDLTPYNQGGFPDSNLRYYDFLFVVSPANVMSGEMSTLNSTTRAKYTPYRFVAQNDCNSADPDNPTMPGDCAASKALRNYGLKLHDVNTAGDPPADDVSRPGSYPLCVLQPN